MADYDSGEITDRERTAAENQRKIADLNNNTLKRIAGYNSNSARTLADINANYQNQLANKNASQTTQVAEFNGQATRNQLGQQIGNYDFANRQNAALRDTQFSQARRKTEAERFEAQRNLQNATIGLLGSMNQAMNGSTVGNAMSMLSNRNDAENSTNWQTLQDNLNSIRNAYDESYNQNQVAKRDAAINALKSIRDIQGDLSSNLGNIQNDLFSNLGNIRSDLLSNLSNIESERIVNERNLQGELAANLNNINPNLYSDPVDVPVPASGYVVPGDLSYISDAQGTGGIDGAGSITKNPIYRGPNANEKLENLATQTRDILNGVSENRAKLLGYRMPANAEQNVRNRRNRLAGNDYFSRLINGYNY